MARVREALVGVEKKFENLHTKKFDEVDELQGKLAAEEAWIGELEKTLEQIRAERDSLADEQVQQIEQRRVEKEKFSAEKLRLEHVQLEKFADFKTANQQRKANKGST